MRRASIPSCLNDLFTQYRRLSYECTQKPVEHWDGGTDGTSQQKLDVGLEPTYVSDHLNAVKAPKWTEAISNEWVFLFRLNVNHLHRSRLPH